MVLVAHEWRNDSCFRYAPVLRDTTCWFPSSVTWILCAMVAQLVACNTTQQGFQLGVNRGPLMFQRAERLTAVKLYRLVRICAMR
jgi:hypothetical protein